MSGVVRLFDGTVPPLVVIGGVDLSEHVKSVSVITYPDPTEPVPDEPDPEDQDE